MCDEIAPELLYIIAVFGKLGTTIQANQAAKLNAYMIEREKVYLSACSRLYYTVQGYNTCTNTLANQNHIQSNCFFSFL